MENERLSVFQDSFNATHSICNLIAKFNDCIEEQNEVAVAGRLVAKRNMGNVIFFKIQSGGGDIQGYVNRKEQENAFAIVKSSIILGDIIGIKGTAFLTKTGEKTVKVSDVEVLSTTMRSLPDKFHGITDPETRYRMRYLDLITSPESREIFRKRFAYLQGIRDFLRNEEFIEVETPIMQNIPGGAAARPFITHHNALDVDFYLRISPETYLKRLVVAGFERVFELGKNFRNEGIDPSHLQEFTMLEFYRAYANYKDNILFTRRLMQHIIELTMGTLQVTFQGTMLDFSGEWKTEVFRDMLIRDTGIDVLGVKDADDMLTQIRQRNIPVDTTGNLSVGTLMDRLYKKVSRPKMIQPTILTGQPMQLLPLARPNNDDPRIADAFQVIIHGWEVVKAYSELADPVIQRRLLEEQAGYRTGGDDEAMFIDEEFLLALEHGLPPVSGVGIGVDRLLAIITGQDSLRDVVFFPMMR